MAQCAQKFIDVPAEKIQMKEHDNGWTVEDYKRMGKALLTFLNSNFLISALLIGLLIEGHFALKMLKDIYYATGR